MSGNSTAPTIGIITALEHEYIAVRQILNQPQNIAVPGRGDRYFTIASVPGKGGGVHQIALCLADKGNNAAATRATVMLQQFQTVHSIIMCGIACGVPSPSKVETHVRLGDVVVSSREGVLKYDFKKETSDAEQIRSNWIPPSADLLASVRLLNAEQLEGKYPWELVIKSLLERLGWRRPSSRSDVLANPDDPSLRIPHPRDASRRSGQPRIFVGPIAAADTLLKNAGRREMLREKFGVMAIEMESSGIADATWSHSIGYLTVRGICDYGDANKGDKWQRYAAAVAASYVRTLLENTAPPTTTSTGADTPPTVSARSIEEDERGVAIRLFVAKTFEDDQYAQLDQAGEADPDRSTLLKQVFVDLELKRRHRLDKLSDILQQDPQLWTEEITTSEGRAFSALNFFLQQKTGLVAVIGGPGHGKSTLGQFLAQIHRAAYLGRDNELEALLRLDGAKAIRRPKIVRLPFRVVLKYYAQWLADRTAGTTIETYLAELVSEASGISSAVSPKALQTILHRMPSLILLDGLDEVTEPRLRTKVLTHVDGFIARLREAAADAQIVATSRPTDYHGDFDPSKFLHVDLQPMDKRHVQAYADRWVLAKVPAARERARILTTLAECMKQEHTRLLLTTPLQVTIVLLIIRGGGRPPALREALFQEYWNTILKREKAKAKDVIHTDDQVLFDLHAYLAFVLHVRAAARDTKALLPEPAFVELVKAFLRLRDRVSEDDAIEQKAQMVVRDARHRLVLIVEPEEGWFGFELRSIQEFFAAVYLTQTAEDTEQRFARLRAIAVSAHWRNVVLFCCGRIARSFSGEAGSILERVCRPMDREPESLFLLPGSFLALEIAADGSIGTNRDLQYSAIELGMHSLREIRLFDPVQNVTDLIKKLPKEDVQDIVCRIIEKQVASTDGGTLVRYLRVYTSVMEGGGRSGELLKRLDASKEAQKDGYAFVLAVRHLLLSKWVVDRTRNLLATTQHAIWSLLDVATISPEYAGELFDAACGEECDVDAVVCKFLGTFGRTQRAEPILLESVDGKPRQLVLAFQLLGLLSARGTLETGVRAVKSKNGHGVLHLRSARVGVPRFSASNASRLAKFREEHLPASLVFLVDAACLALDGADQDAALKLYRSSLDLCGRVEVDTAALLEFLQNVSPWVYRAVAIGLERGVEDGAAVLRAIGDYGIAVLAIDVQRTLQHYAERASAKEWRAFVLGGALGEWRGVGELSGIAARCGLSVTELLWMFVSNVSASLERLDAREAGIAVSIILQMQSGVRHRQVDTFELAQIPWDIDENVLVDIKKYFSHPRAMWEAGIARNYSLLLLLKLLRTHSRTTLVRELLCSLGSEARWEENSAWPFIGTLFDFGKEALATVVEYYSSASEALQKGAMRVLSHLTRSVQFHIETHLLDRVKVQLVRLMDPETGLKALRSVSAADRLDAIRALAFVNIGKVSSDEGRELMDLMCSVKSAAEGLAWRTALDVWCWGMGCGQTQALLRGIVARGEDVAPEILLAAMRGLQQVAPPVVNFSQSGAELGIRLPELGELGYVI